jgi:hypothetical protein
LLYDEKTERKRNSIEDGILTRNHLTTYRNVELETIEMASYWQKRKEKVAYTVRQNTFCLKACLHSAHIENIEKRMRNFAPTATTAAWRQCGFCTS